MAQMRAVLVQGGKGPAENLFIGETLKPTPSASQVLVAVKAFGVNRMDISQRQGKYAVPAGAVMIMGVEFSGTVAEVGKDVTQWKEHDEVIGLVSGGAYAQYVVAPETHIWPKPEHLTWAQAAAIPENWLTAFQALTIADFTPGESALIHTGASGVGLAAIQLARIWEAKHVITTASIDAKLDQLLKLSNGPTHVINYKTQDFAAEVKKITGDAGVEVIVDFPGQSHFVQNIDSLAVDGRMTMLALMSGAEVSSFSLVPILAKRLRIQGSTLRARSAEYQADLIKRFKMAVSDHLSGEDGDGPLKIYIHQVYSMDKIQEAHRDIESNTTIGKVVVTV